MRLWALDLLRCPVTGSKLSLENPEYQGQHIMKGLLRSDSGQSYQIVAGVPRFVLELNQGEKNTAKAFGEEWQKFNKSEGHMGSQSLFFDFVRGLSPADFQNKVILDAGCGNGRWTKVMSSLSSNHVVAMDFSLSVDACFQNTKDLENVVVVQASIYEPPFPKKQFDLIVSIGVIDHTPDTKEALNILKGILQDNGQLSFWVYALEGNEFYLTFINPLRYITTKMPKLLLLPLCYFLAAIVWVHTHIINVLFGLRKDGSERLPMANYFTFLKSVKFPDIVLIIYDQLCPALASYIPEKDLKNWLSDLNLTIASFIFRNSNSYSVTTKKK